MKAEYVFYSLHDNRSTATDNKSRDIRERI